MYWVYEGGDLAPEVSNDPLLGQHRRLTTPHLQYVSKIVNMQPLLGKCAKKKPFYRCFSKKKSYPPSAKLVWSH